MSDSKDRSEDYSQPGRQPRKSDVIVGNSPWIKELFERIDMVAPTNIAVAISGESGTGKELVARTIHNLSKRRNAAFVVVNCAAITESLLEDELFGHVRGAFTDANRDRPGLFSEADGGTLFLDEIGEMSIGLQAKLLRVLQEQEFRRVGADKNTQVDIRLVTATNRNLHLDMTAGRFREDLFYRINVFPLPMMPLRERPEDIVLLAQHFLLKYRDRVGRRASGFTAEALDRLRTYEFPGNIRELENKVHQALVLVTDDFVGAQDLDLGDTWKQSSRRLDMDRPFRDLKREHIDSFEREYTLKLLRAHDGNVASAARQAGIDRKNLWAMAKRHNIALDKLREGKS
ncbi:MAG: AAA family ATPase [Myxococcales bacterium]|nr:AAA family ATPase [Myxococcales bacterium]